MSKMKIKNIRNKYGKKIIRVDCGWEVKEFENGENLNWDNSMLSGDIVDSDPVFTVGKEFFDYKNEHGYYPGGIETFTIIEERTVIDTVDLKHEISQYEYEFGTTIPKKKLKEIIKKLQHKEVIK